VDYAGANAGSKIVDRSSEFIESIVGRVDGDVHRGAAADLQLEGSVGQNRAAGRNRCGVIRRGRGEGIDGDGVSTGDSRGRRSGIQSGRVGGSRGLRGKAAEWISQ